MAHLRPVLSIATVATLTSALTAQLPPIDSGGFLVSDFGNDRVAIYAADGSHTGHFSTPGLDGPRGILFASNGQTFVASQNNDTVYTFDAARQLVGQFSHPELDGPTGMAESPTGELLVSSFFNARVCVFAMDGTFQRSFTAPTLSFPNCAAFDSDGNIYVASAGNGRVFKFDTGEQFVTSFTSPAPTFLSSPMGIARDNCDVLYVAGGGSHNIVKFATDGTFLGALTHPDLTGPQGVAIDDRGHVFSSSFFQHKLVEFDANGAWVQTITAGGLNVPRSIAFKRLAEPGIEVYGCGVNPAGSIVVQSGRPVLGTTVSLGLHDPTLTQTPGSTAPWLLGSTRALANYPCGFTLPGLGEILIELASLHLVLLVPAPTWNGTSSTAAFLIPDSCDLVGVTLHTQGVLLDSSPGATRPIAFTDAARIRIGSH